MERSPSQGPKRWNQGTRGTPWRSPPCGRPHPHVGPQNWPLSIHVIPKIFWSKAPKGGFPKISQKALSLFTTTFFSVWSNWKYSYGLRTILVPTKIIFNASRNNSGLVIFICEKHLKRFRQLRNISGFHPGKFQKVSRMILAPSKNYQACAKTNLTLWYPLKQLFSFTGTHPVTSLRNFSAVRNFSGVRNFFGDFLSDSLSSIQQIDDP